MAEVDFSELGDDFDPEKIDQGGLPKPGKAHLLVASVEDKGEFVKVTSEIIAHDDSSQVGKNEYNSFNKTGKGSKRSLLFALATGLITKQDIVDAKTSGGSIDIDFKAAETQTFLGTLASSSYNGKDKCRVEWDFKNVSDPDAKDYPRNTDYVDPLPDAGSEEKAEEKPQPKKPDAKKPAGKVTGTKKKETESSDIPF